MELKTISELQNGDKIDGYYLVKAVQNKISSNNKKYMDFTLGDSTGDINAKLWDSSEEQEEIFTVNSLIKVRGSVAEWQNSLQLKIDKIRLTNEEDGVDISDFVATAPFEPEDMFMLIMEYVEKIEDKGIKAIVNTVMEENHDKLMYFPAAMKNHHAVRSGLLYHVSTMLQVGEKLSEIYTFLNKDLLFAGVILHDMSKLEEMNSSELGIVSEYTIEGQLLGHIIQGIKKVEEIGEKVGADKEAVMMLEHMILSHHYEPEYGSPKKPMFPEAEILHYLDKIDATMYDVHKHLSTTETGQFTDSIWSLEKRKMFKSKYSNI